MPSTSEQALETTLNDLANARLRDRAPGLVDYLMGFQLVDSEEDGTRAIGIFGFEIDDSIYYVPAGFANGEVRGVESIYSVDSDLFMPLTEDWVNTLIRRKSQKLGDTDKRSMQQIGIRQPNYRRLTQLPPSNTKMASDIATMKVARDFVGMDLVEGLEALNLKTAFYKTMQKSPKLASAVRTFYGDLDFMELPKVAAEKKVTIVTGFTSEGVDRLTDAQRKDIIRGGVAVLDDRPMTDKSLVWKTETALRMSSPGTNGLYDVLMADGSIEAALCARLGRQEADNDEQNLFVATTGKHGFVPYRSASVVREYSKDQLADWIDKNGTKIDNLGVNDQVVFIGLRGDISLPFRIKSIINGADGFKVYTGCCDPVLYESYDEPADVTPVKVANHLSWEPQPALTGNRLNTVTSSVDTRLQGYPVERINQVVVRSGTDTRIVYSSNKLVVCDQGVRAFVVGGKNGTPKGQLLRESDLGNFTTTQNILAKVAQDVSVWRSGDGQINIRDAGNPRGFTKVAALEHLICGLGMPVSDATSIVGEASYKPQKYWVKRATDLQAFPELNDKTDGGYMGQFTPELQTYETHQTVGSPDNTRFYDYISPFVGGVPGQDDQGTLDTLSQAAQLGNKEVFDAAALASLIKAARPTEMVERFLPTMVSGMDRLGRLLFLVLWHSEEFKKRFGEDLPEIVDNLRSTFEHLGELVIKLKERSLSGDPSFFGTLDVAE